MKEIEKKQEIMKEHGHEGTEKMEKVKEKANEKMKPEKARGKGKH